MNAHFQSGVLYMENRKSNYGMNWRELCEHVRDCQWVVGVIERVPRIVPAWKNATYLLLEETTQTDNGGKTRAVDDFKHKVQLKNIFIKKSTENKDAGKVFAQQFNVNE